MTTQQKQQKRLAQATDGLYQLLGQRYSPYSPNPTKAAVNRAIDEYFAALGPPPTPRKQLATPPRNKETHQMNANERVRSANEIAVLLADMSASHDQPSREPSANDGAVAAILKKAMEPLTTQLGGPIEPGHRLYIAPVPTYGDGGRGPVSPVMDLSIQHPMKGWSTLDACLYRKRMAAEAEQNRQAELDRLRIR